MLWGDFTLGCALYIGLGERKGEREKGGQCHRDGKILSRQISSDGDAMRGKCKHGHPDAGAQVAQFPWSLPGDVLVVQILASVAQLAPFQTWFTAALVISDCPGGDKEVANGQARKSLLLSRESSGFSCHLLARRL